MTYPAIVDLNLTPSSIPLPLLSFVVIPAGVWLVNMPLVLQGPDLHNYILWYRKFLKKVNH